MKNMPKVPEFLLRACLFAQFLLHFSSRRFLSLSSLPLIERWVCFLDFLVRSRASGQNLHGDELALKEGHGLEHDQKFYGPNHSTAQPVVRNPK